MNPTISYKSIHTLFFEMGMAKYVEKLNKLATTVGLDNIFVGWLRQEYGIDNYEDSAIGLAGAAILKRLNKSLKKCPISVFKFSNHCLFSVLES